MLSTNILHKVFSYSFYLFLCIWLYGSLYTYTTTGENIDDKTCFIYTSQFYNYNNNTSNSYILDTLVSFISNDLKKDKKWRILSRLSVPYNYPLFSTFLLFVLKIYSFFDDQLNIFHLSYVFFISFIMFRIFMSLFFLFLFSKITFLKSQVNIFFFVFILTNFLFIDAFNKVFYYSPSAVCCLILIFIFIFIRQGSFKCFSSCLIFLVLHNIIQSNLILFVLCVILLFFYNTHRLFLIFTFLLLLVNLTITNSILIKAHNTDYSIFINGEIIFAFSIISLFLYLFITNKFIKEILENKNLKFFLVATIVLIVTLIILFIITHHSNDLIRKSIDVHVFHLLYIFDRYSSVLSPSILFLIICLFYNMFSSRYNTIKANTSSAFTFSTVLCIIFIIFSFFMYNLNFKKLTLHHLNFINDDFNLGYIHENKDDFTIDNYGSISLESFKNLDPTNEIKYNLSLFYLLNNNDI